MIFFMVVSLLFAAASGRPHRLKGAQATSGI
jgi:hypothetical protein